MNTNSKKYKKKKKKQPKPRKNGAPISGRSQKKCAHGPPKLLWHNFWPTKLLVNFWVGFSPPFQKATPARRKKLLRQAQPRKAATAPLTLQRGKASERPEKANSAGKVAEIFGTWLWHMFAVINEEMLVCYEPCLNYINYVNHKWYFCMM